MSEFPIIPANKNSAAQRKLVYGIGINDADYLIRPRINGKDVMCPFYKCWANMLNRSYCQKFHARQPTYIGCTVCPEWLIFSEFKKWMQTQSWEGMELDKDLLVEGNKVYSPETCVFVDRAANQLLGDSAAARGQWPIGVCFHKAANRFIAHCSIEGKNTYLGLFDTPDEAHAAYLVAKADDIKRVAELQSDPRVRKALLLRC